MNFILKNDTPIFIQIEKYIKDSISNGSLKSDEQIPSTTEFSLIYKVNPATVLKGYNILIKKEILYKRRGIGLFVSKGARQIIHKEREDSFINKNIKNLCKEAKLLNMDIDKLISIIKYKYDKEKEDGFNN